MYVHTWTLCPGLPGWIHVMLGPKSPQGTVSSHPGRGFFKFEAAPSHGPGWAFRPGADAVSRPAPFLGQTFQVCNNLKLTRLACHNRYSLGLKTWPLKILGACSVVCFSSSWDHKPKTGHRAGPRAAPVTIPIVQPPPVAPGAHITAAVRVLRPTSTSNLAADQHQEPARLGRPANIL